MSIKKVGKIETLDVVRNDGTRVRGDIVAKDSTGVWVVDINTGEYTFVSKSELKESNKLVEA